MCSRSRLKLFQQCLEAMQKRLQTLKVCSSTNLQCNVVWVQDTVETDMTLQPETKTDSQAKALGCDVTSNQNHFFQFQFPFSISIDENHHSIRSKGFDSRQPSRQCRFPLFNLPKHRQLSEPKYVQLLAWQKLHFFHQKRRHSDVFSSSVEREIVGKW